jgi:hypothetical protein
MRRALFLSSALALSACFDFDRAFQQYCDGGRCDATSDAGEGDAGTDAGTVDAGCHTWGTACTGNECCETSNTGLKMACDLTNHCTEVSDCRNSGFSCAADTDCCTHHCDTGRCTATSEDGTACATASECASGSACVNGKCAATPAPDGALCQSSASCTSAWCAPSATATHEGTCTAPSGCAGVGADGQCCGGLQTADGGSSGLCCMPEGAWCSADSACCTGNCYGGRCTTEAHSPPIAGDHCDGNCAGRAYCDLRASLCVTRWCLGNDPFKGKCCSWDNPYGPCRFPDGTSCLLPGIETTSAQACCSGTSSTWSDNKVRCEFP